MHFFVVFVFLLLTSSLKAAIVPADAPAAAVRYLNGHSGCWTRFWAHRRMSPAERQAVAVDFRELATNTPTEDEEPGFEAKLARSLYTVQIRHRTHYMSMLRALLLPDIAGMDTWQVLEHANQLRIHFSSDPADRLDGCLTFAQQMRGLPGITPNLMTAFRSLLWSELNPTDAFEDFRDNLHCFVGRLTPHGQQMVTQSYLTLLHSRPRIPLRGLLRELRRQIEVRAISLENLSMQVRGFIDATEADTFVWSFQCVLRRFPELASQFHSELTVYAPSDYEKIGEDFPLIIQQAVLLYHPELGAMGFDIIMRAISRAVAEVPSFSELDTAAQSERCELVGDYLFKAIQPFVKAKHKSPYLLMRDLQLENAIKTLLGYSAEDLRHEASEREPEEADPSSLVAECTGLVFHPALSPDRHGIIREEVTHLLAGDKPYPTLDTSTQKERCRVAGAYLSTAIDPFVNDSLIDPYTIMELTDFREAISTLLSRTQRSLQVMGVAISPKSKRRRFNKFDSSRSVADSPTRRVRTRGLEV